MCFFFDAVRLVGVRLNKSTATSSFLCRHYHFSLVIQPQRPLVDSWILHIRALQIQRARPPVWSEAGSLIMGQLLSACKDCKYIFEPNTLFHGGIVVCVLGEMFVPLNS
ncbi:hypothetical protein AMECASPLE_039078 [Ameca splendens]|uniref:Uncharacterized protein n=1 Tax=Ameca splendens TaxID=208324 RepID=A0ABV0XXB4_9TELE